MIKNNVNDLYGYMEDYGVYSAIIFLSGLRMLYNDTENLTTHENKQVNTTSHSHIEQTHVGELHQICTCPVRYRSKINLFRLNFLPDIRQHLCLAYSKIYLFTQFGKTSRFY